MHTKLIDKIVSEGSSAQMHEMRDWVVCLVDELKALDYNAYLEAEKELHQIVYGDHLCEELARKWVSHMKNKDGSCGAHWTIEQTKQMAKDKGLDFDCWDWYATLNMVYSDFYSSKFDTTTYVELARDWLSDKDVGSAKLLDYYFYVVCDK